MATSTFSVGDIEGELSSLNDAITNLQKNNIGNRIQIGGYRSTSNMYTFGADGYIRLYTYNTTTQVNIVGANGSTITDKLMTSNVKGGNGITDVVGSVFVRKGMKCYFSSITNDSDAYFYPLE